MNTEPTPADLESPLFNAIWGAIKKWDLDRMDGPEESPVRGYAGATGTDVMTIMNAIKGIHKTNIQFDVVVKAPDEVREAIDNYMETVQNNPNIIIPATDNEKLGQAIDRVESMAVAITIPASNNIHVESFRRLLPEIVKELKEGFVEATGENPWE